MIVDFTTFLTMVYIVFVKLQILGVAGMDTSAVFVTTCLIVAFSSILIGLFVNILVSLCVGVTSGIGLFIGMKNSGVLMTSSLEHVKWQGLTKSVPAFIATVMIPFSFSITEGIDLGFISYCVMKF